MKQRRGEAREGGVLDGATPEVRPSGQGAPHRAVAGRSAPGE